MGAKTSGKREHQKLKAYLILQLLQKETDEETAMDADNLVAALEASYGIQAERRSIYKDIDEINKTLYMLEHECSFQEADEAINDPECGEDEKYIVYDHHKAHRGFYMRQRLFSPEDIRFLVECVYAAKFIDEKRARQLAKVAASLVSEKQSKDILHDAFLIDRTKTANTAVYYSVSIINQAMSRGSEKNPHKPEKITFKYQTYTIQDIDKTIDRRKGEKYKVSPYRLLINDGNYYLLAFDDKSQKMRTYRVDRMKAVTLTGEPRDGEEAFETLEFQSYPKRVFGMKEGERKHVILRFINPLLDTVIDRFGTKTAYYAKADDKHFTVITEVEMSDQFFSWLCGFGKRVKIMTPEIAKQFAAYLDKIRSLY